MDIVRDLVFKKETEGTYVYKCDPRCGQAPITAAMYIYKYALPHGAPQLLRLTLEVVEDAIADHLTDANVLREG